MSSRPGRNVELKARDVDRTTSLEICARIGAVDRGTMVQRDTYFEAPRGRLKLREEEPGSPHLIHYLRADEAGARASTYQIAGVTDAAALRSLLDACLGVRAVVTKRRHLFLWRDVRIHLDDVDGLGSFIELEAVAPPSSDLTHEQNLITELRALFRVSDARLVSVGYADQLFPGQSSS